MDKLKSTNMAAMAIGILAIGFGLYGAFTGSTFQEYFFTLFIGLCLFGTASLNNTARNTATGE